jgi:hypothetical protein
MIIEYARMLLIKSFKGNIRERDVIERCDLEQVLWQYCVELDICEIAVHNRNVASINIVSRRAAIAGSS